MGNFNSIRVRTRIHCCSGCVPPKRQVGCHVWCEEYLAEKKEHDEIKDTIYENRAKDAMVRETKIRAIEKVKKRHKR